jgi:hypothetical protein
MTMRAYSMYSEVKIKGLHLLIWVAAMLLMLSSASASSAVSDSTKMELDGKMSMKKSDVMYLTMDVEVPLSVGQIVEMQKHVEKKQNGFSLTMWLVVATVEVLEVDANTAQVKLIKEESVIYVNDEKRAHFEDKMVIKLTWMEPEQ